MTDSSSDATAGHPPDPVDRSDDRSDGRRTDERATLPTLGGSVLAAVKIALAGAAFLALIECLGALAMTAGQLTGGGWLAGLFLAAVGKAAVTHSLLWIPLLVVVAVGRWVFVSWRVKVAVRGLLRAKSEAQAQARAQEGTATIGAPEPALAAAFVVLAGVIVIPADLELAKKASPMLTTAACLGSAAAAIAVYWILRLVGRPQGGRRLRRWTSAAGACGLAVTVVSGIAFVRSPLLDPGGYRVANATDAGAVQDRTNVLWIVLDTSRADRMSLYGHSRRTTPFLERFAARSAVFDRCISDGMWTVPAHGSMFTGLSPRQHGADQAYPWLEDSFVTLADALSDADYNTASFSNNPWIAPHSNLTQGFDLHRVIYHCRHLTTFSLEHLVRKLGWQPPVPWLDPDLGGALTNGMVADWLDEYSRGTRPFLLFVNYMEAHLPYAVPRSYRELFMTPEQVARSYALRHSAYGPLLDALDFRFNLEGPDFLAPSDREVLTLLYESSLRYLDARVAELIDMFRQRGLLDNTLVVICSDHGESLGTRDLWGHRFLTYNDLTHVLLMLREPGRQQGVRVSTPVQLSDLYHTVLGAVLDRHEQPAGFDARDLFDLAAGQPDEQRVVVSTYFGPSPAMLNRLNRIDDPGLRHRSLPQIAAQDARWKYIVSTDERRELYDLSADPDELHNLIDDHPEQADRLAAFIDQWLAQVTEHVPADPDHGRDRDPAVIRDLRNLGYLSGRDEEPIERPPALAPSGRPTTAPSSDTNSSRDPAAAGSGSSD
ncbi:MAG: sulfatase [Planctomycetes bacterium]|nr:sulfatase [Planctomycetota bacterium]